MTVDLSQELILLSEEAERLRLERCGKRIWWPEGFRKKVIDLVSRGIRASQIAQAAKISVWSILRWRHQVKEIQKGFSELRLVSLRGVRKKVLKNRESQTSEIFLFSPRGFEIKLPMEDFHSLLQEGLF